MTTDRQGALHRSRPEICLFRPRHCRALREVGLSDKGIVQLVHLVSDFAAYNRLNLALDTDYDYRDVWRSLAFGWEQKPGLAAGDNARGIRE